MRLNEEIEIRGEIEVTGTKNASIFKVTCIYENLEIYSIFKAFNEHTFLQ